MPAENEYELHRIISVKTKLIIRIFMKENPNRIRAKIEPNLCAFLQGSVTIYFFKFIYSNTNAKKLSWCFKDYAKTCNKPWRKKNELLGKFDLYNKDIRITQKIYSKQTASEQKEINWSRTQRKKRVRQGLFSERTYFIYNNEMILK